MLLWYENPLVLFISASMTFLVLTQMGVLDQFFSKREPGVFKSKRFGQSPKILVQGYGTFSVESFNEKYNIIKLRGLDRTFHAVPMVNLFPKSMGACVTGDAEQNLWELVPQGLEDRGYMNASISDMRDIAKASNNEAGLRAETRRIKEELREVKKTTREKVDDYISDVSKAKQLAPTAADFLASMRSNENYSRYERNTGQTER